ncbi:uncharacterized protein LOC132708516 [Cylas formicarius]|nr:uncharacterized protein LOC132708516 [Cylas formicarius]
MPKLPEIHKINGAELKVYQDAKVNKLPFLKLSVAVYRLVKTFLGIPELEKISENITTKDYTGWLTFDISKAFTSWVSQAAHAFKLYISVHPVGTDKALPSSYIGIDFRTTNRPYVVAFLKTNEK